MVRGLKLALVYAPSKSEAQRAISSEHVVVDDIEGDSRTGVFLDAHARRNGDMLCFFYLNQQRAHFAGVPIEGHDVDMPEEPRRIELLLRSENFFRVVP